MGLKIRIALLLCLAAAAAWSAAEAVESLRPPELYQLPREIYAGYSSKEEQAEYMLRAENEYVAVYYSGGDKAYTTDIELSRLRGADVAMLKLGIPVSDREELLALLEDLDS